MRKLRKYMLAVIGAAAAIVLTLGIALPANAVGTYPKPSEPKCDNSYFLNFRTHHDCDIRDAFRKIKGVGDAAKKLPILTKGNFYKRHAAIPTMVYLTLGSALHASKKDSKQVKAWVKANNQYVSTALDAIEPTSSNGQFPDWVTNAQITCVQNVLLTAQKRYAQRSGQIKKVYSYLKTLRYGNEQILKIMEKYEIENLYKLTSDRITWIGPYLDIIEGSEGPADFAGMTVYVQETSAELLGQCNLRS